MSRSTMGSLVLGLAAASLGVGGCTSAGDSDLASTQNRITDGYAPLVRSFRPGGGHYASLYQAPAGFTEEQRYYVRTNDGPTPIYACRVGTHNLVTTDPGCEGQERIGQLGFLDAVSGEGKTAIYRCGIGGGQDHMISPDPGCESQTVENGGQPLGYAWTYVPGGGAGSGEDNRASGPSWDEYETEDLSDPETAPAPEGGPGTSSPPPQAGCGTMTAGQSLGVNASLFSCNRQYQLVMQTDGNLVLYRPGGGAAWATFVFGSGNSAQLQTDGNFVVYSSAGVPLWHTHTHGNAGAHVVLGDSGELAIYSTSNQPLWRARP